ncbi:MAG: flagellar basal-body rod modification protein FlgD [Bacillota bacterium]|nr:flagellar basal-body rod modification protein FlgD [Bacillota bacterium]MDK2925044.1 flagellar basal-body rod modification protein FlgD [Bacillota bacterium]
MNVSSVGGAGSGTGSLLRPQELGNGDFLQLLVTQLRLQDPLEPVKEQDFIAQLAQFGTLEGVNNLAAEVRKLNDLVSTQLLQSAGWQAVGLIGRRVTVVLENTQVTGVVTGVRWADGRPKLLIGKEAYDLAQLKEVQAESPALTEEGS